MGNNLSLPDGIRHEGFVLQWENSQLSPEACIRVARIHELITSLQGLDDVLESDELLTDKHNEGIFNYECLPYEVRWGMRSAKKVLWRELRRQFKLFHKSVMDADCEVDK